MCSNDNLSGGGANYSYFIADRWSHALKSSFDCTYSPDSIKIASYDPLALEDGQTQSSPASINIGKLAMDFESYFADKHTYDIRQLEQHAAKTPPPPASTIALARRAEQPTRYADLIKVADLFLTRGSSINA